MPDAISAAITMPSKSLRSSDEGGVAMAEAGMMTSRATRLRYYASAAEGGTNREWHPANG
jgi:hypothetical protein